MTRSKRLIYPALFVAGLGLSGFCSIVHASNAASPTGSYPIAGIHPSERPAGAPVIQKVEKNAAWYRHALHGVQAPYPASLRFLEDEGNWYTPFNHPGMSGPYDIRHWHSK